MKIVVLTGSPHRNGTSAYLADHFIRGAEAAGHDVFRFDAAFRSVGFCLGCGKCAFGEKDCIQKDDFELVRPALLAADMIVFAFPVYFFGIPAQLKRVIDRFFGITIKLQKKAIRCALLLTFEETTRSTAHPIEAEYEAILNYYEPWSDAGRIIAPGMCVRADIEASDFGAKAYEFGRSLV